jgi:purine-binding chemotaxis protein CheW
MNRPAWDDLWAVLHETADILNQDATNAAADTLDDRTRQLAQPRLDEASVGYDTRHVLAFRLGDERYAWPVENVQAIARLAHLTHVPSAPTYYRGVTSLRGQVLSVMDLRIYLGLPPLEITPEFMMVIDGAGLEIAVLANNVSDVIAVSLEKLAPASSAGLDTELMIGVTTEGLTVLNAEALLRRERARVESEDR